MADQSQVEAAIEAAIDTARLAAGATWDISRGWPNAAEQTAAEDAGVVMVTVAPRQGFVRNTTRWPEEESSLPVAPVSLTVTVSGNTATFAGICTPDEIAGVQVGTTAWALRCAGTDTPATVAASLATMSGGSAAGAVLTLAGLVTARTARDAPAIRPTRQIEQGFQVIIWAADPAARDAAASAVDAALSDIPFLALADGSWGRLRFSGTATSDKAQSSDLYRRDLYMTVDYSTTIPVTRTPVLFPGILYAPATRIGALAP